jgi:hypothetical protein
MWMSRANNLAYERLNSLKAVHLANTYPIRLCMIETLKEGTIVYWGFDARGCVPTCEDD